MAMALTLQRVLKVLRILEIYISRVASTSRSRISWCAPINRWANRKVKNITDPISVYRVLSDPAAVNHPSTKRRPAALFAILTVGVIAIVGGGYLLLLQNQIANQAPTPAVAPITPQQIPEMVSIPGGTFAMGSDDDLSEKPIHRVTIKPFAISKFPITVREWNACLAAKSCTYLPTGKDDAPVANLSRADAQQFVDWLSKVTQKQFRLPSEAEWEYAARGGTKTKFWWGDQLQANTANCKGCNEPYDTSQPLKVGSFKPNSFGLYDMGGTVHQWVADCWHKNYQGAPSDGSAWVDNDCRSYVIRSGSWKNDPSYVRPSSRDYYDTGVRYPTHGLRVAHSL